VEQVGCFTSVCSNIKGEWKGWKSLQGALDQACLGQITDMSTCRTGVSADPHAVCILHGQFPQMLGFGLCHTMYAALLRKQLLSAVC